MRWFRSFACDVPALLLTLMVCAPSPAAVVYVNKNAAGDVQDGTSWATAFSTIQAGVNAAKVNDEVWVAASTPAAPSYVEDNYLASNKALYGGFAGTETQRNQRDWKANPTIVEGNQAAAVIAIGVGTVDGFTIRNGKGVNGGISVGFTGTATISNNTICGNSNYGVYAGYLATATLTNNIIRGNSGGGVYGLASSTVTLANNVVSDNGGDGVSGPATLANNTICANAWNGVYGASKVTNNTISGNCRDGILLPSGASRVVNNIVAFNGGSGVDLQSGMVSLFSHNDVYGNAGGQYAGYTPPTDQGNIGLDPGLSRIYHDIHIQPGSPCIDAGDDSRTSGATDIDGQARTIGAHVDIGSDESDGTTWSKTARIWHVSLSGSDTADGLTWSTAKRTMVGALAVSQDPDEIWVAKGIYAENVSIPAGVSLYGGFAGAEEDRNGRRFAANPTVIDGGRDGDVVSCRFLNAVVDGFTIRNGGANGIIVNGGSATITHSTINGNFGAGVLVDSTGTVTIANSSVSANGEDGVNVRWGNATVTGTTIVSNSGNGVRVYTGTAAVANTILASNQGYGVYHQSGDLPSFAHNDVYGNTSGDYYLFTPPSGQGNMGLDPKLSGIYHDIHIQPGSPCIDAGDDGAASGASDVFGKPRIIGAHADIGADESDGTTWVASTTIRRVSPTGSDSGDGLTWDTAKKTVTEALSEAQGGDEVWVAAGMYPENVVVPAGVALYGGFAGTESERSLRNAAGIPTVLDGGSVGHVVLCPFVNVVVDGFTIANGRGDSDGNIPPLSYTGGGVYVKGGSGRISNNVIVNNVGSGVRITSSGAVTVANNMITGNENGCYSEYAALTLNRNAIRGNQKSGVNAGGTATITCNVISGNGSDGAIVSDTSTLTGNAVVSNTGAGIRVIAGTTTLINNTLADNGDHGLQAAGGTVTADNNVVTGNARYGANVSPGVGVTSFSHNDVYGNVVGNLNGYAVPVGQGNISLDPLYADRSRGNYRLIGSSPCVDAGGDSYVTLGDTDQDGKPRINGAHVDIGAYEFDPSAYVMADLLSAFSIAGGLTAAPANISRLNVEQSGASATAIDLADAIRLFRKVMGMDMNP